MTQWSLSNELQIYIYGAGKAGRELLEALNKQGIFVAAMIDARYNEIRECYSIPVISPDESFHIDEPEKMAVLITLQNGMLHEPIARKYINAGISQIVYCPQNGFLTVEGRHRMRKTYREVVVDHCFSNEIDFVYRDVDCGEEKMCVINNSYTKSVSLYYDVNDLYVSGGESDQSLSLYPTDQTKRRGELKGKRVIDFSEYSLLFEHLRKGDATVENTREYLTFSGRYEENEQNKLLEDRKKLYRTYEEIVITDPSYFVDSPIECRYEDGHICIVDGYHRFFYLKEKGCKKVPILLNRKDYYKLRKGLL